MDPISILGTAIAIAQLSTSLFKAADAVCKARKGRHDLATEMSSLSSILTMIQELIEGQEELYSDDAFKELNEETTRIREIVDEVERNLQQKRNRIRLAFKLDALKPVLDKINASKLNLNLILSVMQIAKRELRPPKSANSMREEAHVNPHRPIAESLIDSNRHFIAQLCYEAKDEWMVNYGSGTVQHYTKGPMAVAQRQFSLVFGPAMAQMGLADYDPGSERKTEDQEPATSDRNDESVRKGQEDGDQEDDSGKTSDANGDGGGREDDTNETEGDSQDETTESVELSSGHEAATTEISDPYEKDNAGNAAVDAHDSETSDADRPSTPIQPPEVPPERDSDGSSAEPEEYTDCMTLFQGNGQRFVPPISASTALDWLLRKLTILTPHQVIATSNHNFSSNEGYASHKSPQASSAPVYEQSAESASDEIDAPNGSDAGSELSERTSDRTATPGLQRQRSSHRTTDRDYRRQDSGRRRNSESRSDDHSGYPSRPERESKRDAPSTNRRQQYFNSNGGWNPSGNSYDSYSNPFHSNNTNNSRGNPQPQYEEPSYAGSYEDPAYMRQYGLPWHQPLHMLHPPPPPPPLPPQRRYTRSLSPQRRSRMPTSAQPPAPAPAPPPAPVSTPAPPPPPPPPGPTEAERKIAERLREMERRMADMMEADARQRAEEKEASAKVEAEERRKREERIEETLAELNSRKKEEEAQRGQEELIAALKLQIEKEKGEAVAERQRQLELEEERNDDFERKLSTLVAQATEALQLEISGLKDAAQRAETSARAAMKSKKLAEAEAAQKARRQAEQQNLRQTEDYRQVLDDYRQRLQAAEQAEATPHLEREEKPFTPTRQLRMQDGNRKLELIESQDGFKGPFATTDFLTSTFFQRSGNSAKPQPSAPRFRASRTARNIRTISSEESEEDRHEAEVSSLSSQAMVVLPPLQNMSDSELREIRTSIRECGLSASMSPIPLRGSRSVKPQGIPARFLWNSPLHEGSQLLQTIKNSGWKPVYKRASEYGQTWFVNHTPVLIDYFTHRYRPQIGPSQDRNPDCSEYLVIGGDWIDEYALECFGLQYRPFRGQVFLSPEVSTKDLDALIALTMQHRDIALHKACRLALENAPDQPSDSSSSDENQEDENDGSPFKDYEVQSWADYHSMPGFMPSFEDTDPVSRVDNTSRNSSHSMRSKATEPSRRHARTDPTEFLAVPSESKRPRRYSPKSSISTVVMPSEADEQFPIAFSPRAHKPQVRLTPPGRLRSRNSDTSTTHEGSSALKASPRHRRSKSREQSRKEHID